MPGRSAAPASDAGVVSRTVARVPLEESLTALPGVPFTTPFGAPLEVPLGAVLAAWLTAPVEALSLGLRVPPFGVPALATCAPDVYGFFLSVRGLLTCQIVNSPFSKYVKARRSAPRAHVIDGLYSVMALTATTRSVSWKCSRVAKSKRNRLALPSRSETNATDLPSGAHCGFVFSPDWPGSTSTVSRSMS